MPDEKLTIDPATPVLPTQTIGVPPSSTVDPPALGCDSKYPCGSQVETPRDIAALPVEVLDELRALREKGHGSVHGLTSDERDRVLDLVLELILR